MQYLDLQHSTGLTGKATSEVTSTGHTLQAATHRPSFLTCFLLPCFHLPPFTAGDIGTLVLPEGMQALILSNCTGLTGDIGTLVLPEGMQKLSLFECTGLTGKAKSYVKE